VILPLVARFTFDGDAGTYGLMSSVMGAGAVVGGLYTAGRKQHGPTALALAAMAFGGFILAAAAAPNLTVALVMLFLVGATSITFLALGNTTLQLGAAPEMRGRVMALWAVAFLGSTPVGGPIIGGIGEHIGPRWGLMVGGIAAFLAGALTYRILGRLGAKAEERVQSGDDLSPAAA
jgi:MFS family permease